SIRRCRGTRDVLPRTIGLVSRDFAMFVSRRLSWLLTRASSTHRTRRRRRSALSLGGLPDWPLEDRCLLSTVSTRPTAHPALPLSQTSSSMTSGLSVGSGQTEIIDVSRTPVLNLNGNLNNQGTIYVVSTNPAVTSVSISAQSIINGAGARITTMLPPGGLAG